MRYVWYVMYVILGDCIRASKHQLHSQCHYQAVKCWPQRPHASHLPEATLASNTEHSTLTP